MAITCFLPAPTAALRPSFLGRASPLTTTARPATAPRRRAAVRAVADAADSQLAWVDAIELADVQPGRAYRRVLAGLDICVACAESGEVYALANKGPPLGIPLSDGVVVSVDVG